MIVFTSWFPPRRARRKRTVVTHGDDGTSEQQRRTHRSHLNAGGTALPLRPRLDIVSQSTSSSSASPTTSPPWPAFSRSSLLQLCIACHLPPYLRLRPPRNIAAGQHGLLLAEERRRARDGCICGGGGGLGRRCGEVPDPTLPADERAESAETRGKERWGRGGGGGEREEERVGGELCGPVGRRDRCTRMEDALCTSTVLEYNMWRGAFATGPKTEMMERSERKGRSVGLVLGALTLEYARSSFPSPPPNLNGLNLLTSSKKKRKKTSFNILSMACSPLPVAKSLP